MTRAALYARYSSDRQNERSVADQTAVLTALAERRGWTVVAGYMDAAISGRAMANRPGLLNALAAAERGEFDILLVEDEDRIARDEEHQWHVYNRLAAAGVGLSTLATERVGRMQVAFKSFMAAEYVQVLAAKTRRGMASNAEKGLATGSRLYGYRSQPGGAVEIVPDQAEVIRRIFTLYADDRLQPRAIADRLNAEGVPSPSGGTWSGSTISGSRQRANGILQSEIYAGVKVYGRVEMRKDRLTGKRVTVCKPPDQHRRIPVPHLAIIDRDLWDRAQARRSDQTQGVPSRTRPARRPYLLSGLVFCGVCGAAYSAQGQNRLACAAYREKGPSVCANRRHVNRTEVERRVLTGLRERLLSPAAVAAYMREYHAAWAERAADRRREAAPLNRRLGELTRSIDRAIDLLLDDRTRDVEALTERLRSLEQEKAEVAARLAEAEAGPGDPVIQLHPAASAAYVRRVDALEALIGADSAAAVANPGDNADTDQTLIAAVRDLIHHIDITPTGPEPRSPFAVTLHGDLARLLRSEEATHVGGRMVAGGRCSWSPRLRIVRIAA